MKEQNNMKYVENNQRIVYIFKGERPITNFKEKNIFI